MDAPAFSPMAMQVEVLPQLTLEKDDALAGGGVATSTNQLKPFPYLEPVAITAWEWESVPTTTHATALAQLTAERVKGQPISLLGDRDVVHHDQKPASSVPTETIAAPKPPFPIFRNCT